MNFYHYISANESEQYILANLMGSPSLIAKVLSYINKAEIFTQPLHRAIFSIILDYSNSGKQFDMPMVVQAIPNSMVDISNLSSKAGSGGMIEEHCQAVYEAYCRREFIHAAERVKEGMEDMNIDFLDTITDFKNKQEELLSFSSQSELHIKTAIGQMVDRSLDLLKNGLVSGIPTGFTYFDAFSGGIQKGDLVVLAGETSNGKTTLALNILHNSVLRGTRGAIFSYEQPSFQLAARMVAYANKSSSKDIIKGGLEEKQLWGLTGKVDKLSTSEMYIIKPFSSNFNRLVQDIVRVVTTYKLDLIVIDYLQLLNNPKKGVSTSDMIAEMANKLKSLAVELDVAIILISQLARDRAKPRPTLSRLKGSGDIENAADVVMLVYLPYKCGKDVEDINGENVNIGEDGIVIIDKGRSIGTTEFRLKFIKEVPGFYNYKSESFDYNHADAFIEPVDVDALFNKDVPY